MSLFVYARGWIRKVQAAVVIEKLLQASGAEAWLGHSAHHTANMLVSCVCDNSPGLTASLPHKMTLSIAALSLGIGGLHADDEMRTILYDCIVQIEEHIRGRARELGFRPVDIRLLEWSEKARATNGPKGSAH